MSKYYLNESDRGIIDTTIRKVDYYSGRMTPEEGLPPGGGDTYKGYFKVTNSSTTEVQQLGISSGECVIGDIWFTILESDTTITNNGFLYIESEYTPPVPNDFGDIVVEGIVGTPVILLSEELPEYSDLHYREIIAEVTFASNVITGFTQISHSMIIGSIYDKTKDDLDAEDGGALDKALADIHCATASSCNSTSSGCKRHGNMITLTGKQEDTIVEGETVKGVTSQYAEYDSGTQLDAKCKALGASTDTALYSESCGTVYDVEELNSEDGVTFTRKLFYCCCEKGSGDEATGCNVCSEQNADCEHGDCAESTQKVSSSFQDYKACLRSQTGALSTASIDKYCASLEGYIDSCCIKDIIQCATPEEMPNQFVYKYTPCCCPENTEDPIENCTDCSEQNSQCTELVCEDPEEDVSSDTYTTEAECLEHQTQALTPTGLTAECEAVSNYSEGCCFSNMNACTKVDDAWIYSFALCCCKVHTYVSLRITIDYSPHGTHVTSCWGNETIYNLILGSSTWIPAVANASDYHVDSGPFSYANISLDTPITLRARYQDSVRSIHTQSLRGWLGGASMLFIPPGTWYESYGNVRISASFHDDVRSFPNQPSCP